MFPLFGPDDFGFFLSAPDHAQATPPRPAYLRDDTADSRLALRAVARLRTQLPTSEYSILVEVQNRVVILEGSVPSASLRRHISAIAWDTPGVHDVSNQLVVRSAKPTADGEASR